MATIRPYYIRFNGSLRIVEAAHRSTAIAHLARELVEECRPATAREVAQFYRDGKEVEVAGRIDEPATGEAAGEALERPVDGGLANDVLCQWSFSNNRNWQDHIFEGARYYRFSSDGGATWSDPLQISGPLPAEQDGPSA